MQNPFLHEEVAEWCVCYLTKEDRQNLQEQDNFEDAVDLVKDFCEKTSDGYPAGEIIGTMEVDWAQLTGRVLFRLYSPFK